MRFIGGETGRVLRPLLDDLDADLRLVHTDASSGMPLIDRRGERDMVASAWSDPPSRHEIDDLFSVTVAAALQSEVLASAARSLRGPAARDLRASWRTRTPAA